MRPEVLRRLRGLARSPLAWILLTVGILHVVGLGWGLPASDGWDNDGVAPRDFLPGLAATFTPGRFYTYPPVHLAILAVLTLPISLVAALRAPSLGLHDLVGEILKVPYMTAFSVTARCVSVAMSLGVVLFIARIAEEIRGHELGAEQDERGEWSDARVRYAGVFAGAVAGINASLTYYAHTSNLDVPYLFWASWALLVFTRAITRREPRRLRHAFALAALAVGTKDQAYALFVLSLPVTLALWIAFDEWARAHKGRVLREAAIAAGLAGLLLAAVDGALTNPTGFRARVRFLTGSASQDYAEYTADWSGRLEILVDAGRKFDRQYPVEIALAFGVGIALSLLAVRRAPRERRGAQLAVAALPLLAAISFTVTFNWTARRTDSRFFLPQLLLLAVYGGRAIERLVSPSGRVLPSLRVLPSRRVLRLAGQAVASLVFARGLFLSAAVDANLLFDPRYEMEAWIREHVRPGDTIETYGLNVYMLRPPPGVRLVRVGPEPLAQRNPMPGVEEVQAPYADAPKRSARWILVSTGWVWRYLIHPYPVMPGGQQLAPTQHRRASDAASTQFFEALVTSADAFAIAHEAAYDARLFPVVEVHGTTGRAVWIYERKPGRAGNAPP